MSSIKKESHQRQRSTRRPPPNSSSSTSTIKSPENNDDVIRRDIVIELDMENDATKESLRIRSISSISESVLALYSSTAKSIRVSGSTNTSSQSTVNAALTPMAVVNTPEVTS